jgi:hypothetical protein
LDTLQKTLNSFPTFVFTGKKFTTFTDIPRTSRNFHENLVRDNCIGRPLAWLLTVLSHDILGIALPLFTIEKARLTLIHGCGDMKSTKSNPA